MQVPVHHAHSVHGATASLSSGSTRLENKRLYRLPSMLLDASASDTGSVMHREAKESYDHVSQHGGDDANSLPSLRSVADAPSAAGPAATGSGVETDTTDVYVVPVLIERPAVRVRPNHPLQASTPSPLAVAAAHGHLFVMAALLRRGASPNYAPPPTKLSALMCAAAGGHLKAVALLLAHGAQPTQKDAEGRTAWDIAGAAGQTDVQILLARVSHGGAAGLVTPNPKHPGQLHVDRGTTGSVPGGRDHGGSTTSTARRARNGGQLSTTGGKHMAVLKRLMPSLTELPEEY